MRQFVRYAIVGAAQNGTNLAAFAVLISVDVPYILAALLAAVVSLALSFALNRRWTFRGTDDRATGRGIRFVVVWLAFVAVALPTLALLVDVAHLPRVLSQALIICAGAPLSYLVQRRWTFRPTVAPSSGAAIATTPGTESSRPEPAAPPTPSR